jgi:hypothetical protein
MAVSLASVLQLLLEAQRKLYGRQEEAAAATSSLELVSTRLATRLNICRYGCCSPSLHQVPASDWFGHLPA